MATARTRRPLVAGNSQAGVPVADVDLLATFREIAPEFASSDDARVRFFLQLACSLLDESRYPPNKFGLVVVLLAAHMMWMRGRSANGTGQGGQLVQEKEGDLMRMYGQIMGASSDRDTWLKQSLYGQELAWLEGQIFPTAVMTRMLGEV
ncbi:MAG: DUF4054 domain-containing protein, partial [Paraburkholderia sp.]|nr:DUF4054 domain-containing protein [Paraburkholderia sp.]